MSNEERKKVLEMLAEGNINVEDAQTLLAALEDDTNSATKEIFIDISSLADLNNLGDRINAQVNVSVNRMNAHLEKHLDQLNDEIADMTFIFDDWETD